MKLCNLQAMPLDSRMRGNDGRCAQANNVMPTTHIIPTNYVVTASDVTSTLHFIPPPHATPTIYVIPAPHIVIPANAGIHINNQDIRPDTLPPTEDVKKVERQLVSAGKKALKNPEGLKNK